MSRIGKMPIVIPNGVTVTINNDEITATGPKGTLTHGIHKFVAVNIDNNVIHVTKNSNSDKASAFWGLYRQIINNMVIGVSEGYQKRLVINGVGYKLNLKSPEHVVLNIGFSHPVEVKAEKGITFDVEKNILIVKGVNKELVGKAASGIKDLKPVEPYHFYGIYYENEKLRKKEVKTGKK